MFACGGNLVCWFVLVAMLIYIVLSVIADLVIVVVGSGHGFLVCVLIIWR